MKTTKQTTQKFIEGLEAQVRDTIAKLEKVLEQKARLDDLEHVYRAGIDTYSKTISRMKKDQKLMASMPPIQEVKHTSGPNAKIGDAMEAVLKDAGPLVTRDLIDRLRQRNIRLSEKYPRVVITMTIKQDKAKRFNRLADKRIALRRNKKALIKSAHVKPQSKCATTSERTGV